jgi:hypothetical protein
LGTLLGSNGLAVMASAAWLLPIALAGTLLVAYCWWAGTIEMRLFLLFANLAFAVSLASPGIERRVHGEAWPILAQAPAIRYWLIPDIAFSWVLAWYAFAPERMQQSQIGTQLSQIVGGTLFFVMLFGLIHDWRYPAYPDQKFPAAAMAFEKSPLATVATIRQVPPGWTLRLVRH